MAWCKNCIEKVDSITYSILCKKFQLRFSEKAFLLARNFLKGWIFLFLNLIWRPGWAAYSLHSTSWLSKSKMLIRSVKLEKFRKRFFVNCLRAFPFQPKLLSLTICFNGLEVDYTQERPKPGLLHLLVFHFISTLMTTKII